MDDYQMTLTRSFASVAFGDVLKKHETRNIAENGGQDRHHLPIAVMGRLQFAPLTRSWRPVSSASKSR
ncbi:hypothetical protein MES5069_360177 [Mesorhizobium escarrei]|uniref:Uncharacterized protein n=1 Tax=Mesorhizobium escarrei TaxID=666018 RepID=A0ABM9E238_9HYPH|nr:hypothetical protein MES5069_360177 [Mesorhizobium escarrei]